MTLTFHDVWHWQQWLTALVYAFAMVANVFFLIISSRYESRATMLGRMIALTVWQLVLYSGGWY